NRFGVLNSQCAGTTPAAVDATPIHAAGKNQDHILAKTGNLGLELSLGAIADADHRDHRGDADDDAEHGKNGAQFVSAEGLYRNSYRGEASHTLKMPVCAQGASVTVSASR